MNIQQQPNVYYFSVNRIEWNSSC